MPNAEQAIENDKLHLVSPTAADNAESDQEHPQANERPLATAAHPSGGWGPDNPDIVTFGQRALSIYLNQKDQIVICQEREWDEEDDSFIIVDPVNVDIIIAKLNAVKAEVGGR